MQFILLVIHRYECLFLTWCTHPMFANRQLLRFLIVGRRGTLICHIKSIFIRCVSYCDGLPTSTKEEFFLHFLTNIKNGVTEILSMKHKFNCSLSTGWLECSILQRHVNMFFKKFRHKIMKLD